MKEKIMRVFTALLLALLLLSMTACGTTNNNQSQEPSSSEQISIEIVEEHWIDETKNYTVAVQITINPDAILYLKGETVVGISYLNDDAKDIYFTELVIGKDYNEALCNLFKTASNAGVLKEDGKVSVEIVETKTTNEPLDFVYDTPIEALETVNTETGNNATAVLGGKTEDEWVTYRDSKNRPENDLERPSQSSNKLPNTESTDNVCTGCNGTGHVDCQVCKGTGETIRIEKKETEVRNDYVCPTCSGKGWIDDGMHGGKTAVCGHCGGGVQTPSGDFREKAYDTVIVEEKIPEPCGNCGSTGKRTCEHCNGSGVQ